MTRERRKAVLAFAGFSYLLFGSDRLHLEIRPIKGIFHPISPSVFPVLRNNKDSHGRRFHKRQYPRFPYNCKTAFAAAPYPHGCPVGMTRDFLSIFCQCKRRSECHTEKNLFPLHRYKVLFHRMKQSEKRRKQVDP